MFGRWFFQGIAALMPPSNRTLASYKGKEDESIPPSG